MVRLVFAVLLLVVPVRAAMAQEDAPPAPVLDDREVMRSLPRDARRLVAKGRWYRLRDGSIVDASNYVHVAELVDRSTRKVKGGLKFEPRSAEAKAWLTGAAAHPPLVTFWRAGVESDRAQDPTWLPRFPDPLGERDQVTVLRTEPNGDRLIRYVESANRQRRVSADEWEHWYELRPEADPDGGIRAFEGGSRESVVEVPEEMFDRRGAFIEQPFFLSIKAWNGDPETTPVLRMTAASEWQMSAPDVARAWLSGELELRKQRFRRERGTDRYAWTIEDIERPAPRDP